jgi:hypothetical protein
MPGGASTNLSLYIDDTLFPTSVNGPHHLASDLIQASGYAKILADRYGRCFHEKV